MTTDASNALPDNRVATAVSHQFVDRPTLIMVAVQLLTDAIKEAYPTLDFSALNTRLCIPDSGGGWKIKLLAQVLLDHLGTGDPVDFADRYGRDYYLSHRVPLRLRPDGPGAPGLDMSVVERIIREIPSLLPQGFQQALMRYWGQAGSGGASHWQWLSELLETNLLSAAITHPLPPEATRILLQQVTDYPDRLDRAEALGDAAARVYLIETTMHRQGQVYRLLSADLLVVGHAATLLCSPSGNIESFNSQDGFDRWWGRKIDNEFAVDQITWKCYEPNGNVFDVQAAKQLNQQLVDVAAVELPSRSGIDSLETTFASITDPAKLFRSVTPSLIPGSRLQPLMPDWLQQASANDRLLYRKHLLHIGNAKASAAGRDFLDGIDDIRTFTAKALHRQMLIDQPTAPGYNPDELELTFTVAAGYPGTAGVVEHLRMSLTDLALKNLVGKPRGSMSIRHTAQQLIQPWTTPEYLTDLITRVNIGKVYPELLRSLLLSDTPEARRREQRFGEELKARLPLQALELAIRGESGFTSQGYRYVAALMHSGDANRVVDDQRVVIRSLALLRKPGAYPDSVANMFVIESQEGGQGPHILYRPLYKQPLHQYASRETLLGAMATAGELQDSVLTWLSDRARSVYANGGFREPHIVRFGQGSEFDVPEHPQPATLAYDEGDGELLQCQRDSRLYRYLFGAHARALVDLAERESVSNAESRWAILLEGGGLLFSMLMLPLLQGAAPSIAWLLMLTSSLANDIPALESQDPVARELAWVDLLMSLGLMLLQVEGPETADQPVSMAGPDNLALTLAPLRRPDGVASTQTAVVSPGTTARPGLPIADGRTVLDFAFSNPMNRLSSSQRADLERFKVARPTEPATLIETGRRRGLYRIGDRLHARIDDDWYRIATELDVMFVIDPADPSKAGPFLRVNDRGQWTLDLVPRLRGGAPGDRMKAQRKKNRDLQKKMEQEQERLNREVERLTRDLAPSFASMKTRRDEYFISRAKLRNWWTLWAGNTDERKGVFLFNQLQQQQGLCEVAKSQFKRAFEVFQERVSVLLDSRRAFIKALKPGERAFDTSDFERARSTAYEAISAAQLLIYDLTLKLAIDSDYSAQGESIVAIMQRLDMQAPSNTLGAYHDFITRMEDMAAIEEDLLKNTYALEATLAEHAQDSPRGLADSQAIVKALPAPEMADPFNVILNHLSLLQALSIDGLKLTDAPEVQFFSQRMSQQSLRVSTASHIALRTYSHFTPNERKTVLGTLIRQYEAIERDHRALHELNVGLDRAPYHERFLERLARARSSAEADLATLIREEVGIPVAGASPKPETVRVSTKRVFKTQDRGTLIGDLRVTEVSDPVNIIDVRDSFTQSTVASFVEHPDEGVWKQLVVAGPSKPAPKPAVRALASLKASARQLIEQKEGIVRSIQFQMKKLKDPTRREQVDPMDWHIMLEQQASKLTGVIKEIDDAHRTREGVANLLDGYREQAAQMLADAREYCSTGYMQQKPAQENVDYLWTHRKVDINLVHRRELTASGDYVAELAIRPKNKPEVLWYAHFHYPESTAPDNAYNVAHLKLASQRFLLQRQLVQDAGGNDGAVVKVIYAPITSPLDAKLFLNLLRR